ncbi:MAG TPA: hypothetical protein PKD70_07630 [Saprospiraceae bacterium]|nr:hypothetical protein [Saprospiraceae bacterium]
MEIPFFDNDKLAIIFVEFDPEHDQTFIDEADQALITFLKLNAADRNLISDLAYKNCLDFLDEVEFDEADEFLIPIIAKLNYEKFSIPISLIFYYFFLYLMH